MWSRSQRWLARVICDERQEPDKEQAEPRVGAHEKDPDLIARLRREAAVHEGDVAGAA
jgi:hypothetical protein